MVLSLKAWHTCKLLELSPFVSIACKEIESQLMSLARNFLQKFCNQSQTRSGRGKNMSLHLLTVIYSVLTDIYFYMHLQCHELKKQCSIF